MLVAELVRPIEACDAVAVTADAAVALDPESRAWLEALRSDGLGHPQAVADLYDLLHRAARHEAQRRRGSVPARVADDLDDIARQAASDAVVVVLRKLGTYRGASRFTTWAYKFAIFEVSAALRRESWRGRTVTMDDAGWERLADHTPTTPQDRVEIIELIGAIERAVAADLTARQRDIFAAVVVHEVPIDVLADRLDSTRGAIYKALHDARRKLRSSLEAQGWVPWAGEGEAP
jgi:RNA polymerase sigma-70 factor (ECF subfamily)